MKTKIFGFALVIFLLLGVWGLYVEIRIQNVNNQNQKSLQEKILCANQINRKIADEEKGKEELAVSGILESYSVKGCFSKKYNTCIARIDRDLSMAITDEGKSIVELGTPFQYEMVDLLNGDDKMQYYYSKSIEHIELTAMGWSYGDFLRALYLVDCSDGQDLSEGMGKYEWEKFNTVINKVKK